MPLSITFQNFGSVSPNLYNTVFDDVIPENVTFNLLQKCYLLLFPKFPKGMHDNVKGSLSKFVELLTLIAWAPKDFKR